MLTEVLNIVKDWPAIIDTIHNAIRQFCYLNTSKISLKLTEVSSGPSITMRISLVRLISLSLLQRRVFKIFLWLKEHSTVAVATGRVNKHPIT